MAIQFKIFSLRNNVALVLLTYVQQKKTAKPLQYKLGDYEKKQFVDLKNKTSNTKEHLFDNVD